MDLKYNDFVAWHGAATKSYLQPALTTALRLVDELLNERVEAVDRGRFRISTSRVKSAARTFAKLSQERYSSRLTSTDDIPGLIDDLVGLRLVCNNLSDINTLQEVLGELPTEADGTTSLAVEHESHRDYFASPKPSGYRAYHVNLVVPVPHMSGTHRVRVEVQARTLLQDGWGELTHEDTYKPGSTVPEWIVGMSLRMAELLAAVDNIAQDLRTGLDVEAQRSVLTVDEPEEAVARIVDGENSLIVPTPGDLAAAAKRRSDEPGPRQAGSASLESALIAETRKQLDLLQKPVPLAALSQTLHLLLGAEITIVWASYGGFKKFLERVAPESLLSGPAPGYVHPPNTSVPPAWTEEDTGSAPLPDLVRELRTYDKAIPLISADRLNQVAVAVENVVRAHGPSAESLGNVSPVELELLARLARSDAETRGELVVRPHALYVLQAANRAGLLAGSATATEFKEAILRRVLALASANGLITDRERADREVRTWLGLPIATAT